MHAAQVCQRSTVLQPCGPQISSDRITKTANEHWAASVIQSDKAPAFQPELVVSLYNDELGGKEGTPLVLKRIMLLEVSQYLENYLWPHFTADASFEHVMSIILMVNEKFRGGVPAWTCFNAKPVRGIWTQPQLEAAGTREHIHTVLLLA